VVNERDELGPNLVPDYMTSVQDGGFYGWPWSYWGDHVDPRVYPPRPDMVAQAIPPDYALSSHVAPLGLIFSNGSAMPGQYVHGAFVGEHGSWNREIINGYKVIYVPFENGKPTGQPVDVVTGFIDGDQAHGRPVGVGMDGTGALLVADDVGNMVWRVAAADSTIWPQPVGADVIPTLAASAAPAGTTQGGTVGQVQGVEPTSAPADQATPARTGAPAQTEIAPATFPIGEDTGKQPGQE
jgi:hypothetical protein